MGKRNYEKNNIAELLKDCPQGMELDCTLLDNVVFEKLDFSSPKYPIAIKRTETNTTVYLTEYGQFGAKEDYKCIIFPKGKTTWEGFVPPCKSKKESEDEKIYLGIKVSFVEKQDEQKANKVNPKFKVGDKVKSKTSQYEYTIVDILGDAYIMSRATDKIDYPVPFCNEDNFELIPNKFDINTLVPFESRVLVRDYIDNIWRPAFWGKLINEYDYRFLTTLGCFRFCVPFEGNEHLLGTTDDCDDFYKLGKNE